MVNLSRQTVSELLAAKDQELPLNLKSPGYKRRLSEEQLTDLPKFLEQGAACYGFTGSSWTHERVWQVIEKELPSSL